MVHQKYITLLIYFFLCSKLKSEPVIRHRMMNIPKEWRCDITIIVCKCKYKQTPMSSSYSYIHLKRNTFMELPFSVSKNFRSKKCKKIINQHNGDIWDGSFIMLTGPYTCTTVSFLLVSCCPLHTQAVSTKFQENKSCQTFVKIYSNTAEGNFTFVSQNASLSPPLSSLTCVFCFSVMHLFFTNFQLPNLFNHTILCLVLPEAIKTSTVLQTKHKDPFI